MENASPESCQTCFRPRIESGEQLRSQWVSVCRCDRVYSPKSVFSIDVCANCKRRVATNALVGGTGTDLCSCAESSPQTAATYLKQNESDSITLDLTTIGLAPDSFPLEKYAPIGILGQSARATVLLARDRQRGTKVAVKCFKRLAPALKSTFESEARKNKQLTHTNIAKVVDFAFPDGKTPYLVTEYRDGFNLEQCLSLNGVPSHDVAVKILMGVCEALLYAQKQGVLHRDIRPGNIIFLDDLNSEPSISIADFALPKVKASEALTDRPDAIHMSADEARGLEYNEKSEVYSIGCIGYALLTGRPPFQDGSVDDIKNMHALKLPPKISHVNFDNKRPTDLEEVIERCLEKDPSYRFESVSKLLERLEVFPRREQMKITAVLAARRRKKIIRIAGALLVVAALCAAGYFALVPH